MQTTRGKGRRTGSSVFPDHPGLAGSPGAIDPTRFPGLSCVVGLRALVALVALVALIGASGCGEAESPAARFARDPEALKRGKSLFVGTCGAYCHGLQPGNRDAPYLFDCEWKHGGSDEEIFRTIRGGVPDTRMQAFADRMPEGDEDLWKIVAFLKANAHCS